MSGPGSEMISRIDPRRPGGLDGGKHIAALYGASLFTYIKSLNTPWLGPGAAVSVPVLRVEFSALVKDQGFVLIFPPMILDTGIAIGACGAFWLMALAIRRFA